MRSGCGSEKCPKLTGPPLTTVAERAAAKTKNSWSLDVIATWLSPIGAISSISRSISSIRSYLVSTPAAIIISKRSVLIRIRVGVNVLLICIVPRLENLFPLRVAAGWIVHLGAERDQHHHALAGVAKRMHHTGRDGEPPDLPGRHVEIADLPLLLEADQAGPGHGGDFHGVLMNMIAAHLVGLGQHHAHVPLSGQFRIVQRLKNAAADVPMSLHRLHDRPCGMRGIHAPNYSRAVRSRERDRRT